MSLSLTKTLEVLKERGFSPGDRAFLAKEWMTFSVHFRGERDPAHLTEYHREREVFSRKLQEVIQGLKSPEQLSSSDDTSYTGQRLRALAEGFGVGLGDQKQKVDFLRAREDDLGSERFGEASLNDIIDVLTTGNNYRTFQDMEMDEEDLVVFLSKKSPQVARDFPSPEDLSLQKSYEILDLALKKAKIPLCSLDTMTAENPAACYNLAKSIERSSMSFETLGVEGCGLGLVHLNVNLPYAEGNSGQMSSHYKNTEKSPVSTPTVALSNRCGWEYDEVIIHEMLHAHDALFNAVDERESTGFLLSDKVRKKTKSPLLDEWIKLATKIDNLTSDHSLEVKVKMARSGIAERWASMGLDKVSLLKAVSAWETQIEKNNENDHKAESGFSKKSNNKKIKYQSKDSKNPDLALHKNLVVLFSNTPFAASADFRASAIMAECKLLRELKEDTKPVFRSFVEQFDSLGSVGNKSASYGKGYFEDLSEKMARSIQSTLDTLPSAKQNDNPYEKRWLVYADQSLSPKITECWKEFFQKPCVQEAYDILRETTPNFGNLKDRIEMMRQKKERSSSEQSLELSSKKPSLSTP